MIERHKVNWREAGFLVDPKSEVSWHGIYRMLEDKYYGDTTLVNECSIDINGATFIGHFGDTGFLEWVEVSTDAV